jgi:hypothetical protein
MSDTPRTDACEKIATRRHGYYDRFAIARELESELAEAKEQRDRLAEALERVNECLSNAEDVMHGAGSDDVSRSRRVISDTLAAVKGGTP